MIEQGITMLISAALSSTIPPGFGVAMPKDTISATIPQAWTWRTIASIPNYILSGQIDLTKWVVEISCHGYTNKDAVNLFYSIDGVLRGVYSSGTLSDPQNTYVQGVFRTGSIVDGFSDLNRSFVRTVEYNVFYNQT